MKSIPNPTDCTTESSALPPERAAILGMLGRNTFWLWLDMGALRIGGLLAGFFLIRYFGPHDFGLYSTAMAVGFLVNALSDLGLTRYTARAVSADRREGPPILAVTYLSTAIFALLELIALVVALSRGNTAAAVIIAGLLVNNFEGSAILCSAMLNATLRARLILPGSVISTTCLIVFATLVVLLHLPVLTFVLLSCGRSLIVFLVRLWQLRDLWPDAPAWSAEKLRQTIRSAWPYFTYNITQVSYGRISIVCFGLVASQAWVGIYSAAFVLSDIYPQWSYSASGAVLPLWTRLYEGSRIQELVETRESLLDVIVLISVPIAIGLSVFAPEICSFLGPRFVASAPVLRVIAYRALLSVIDGLVGHGFLIAINQVRKRQRSQLIALVVLALLTLVLGRWWGPQGVAIALFVADATLIAQYYGILSKLNLHIRTWFFVPVCVAGGCMALVSLLVPSTLGLATRVITGLLAYALTLFVLSGSRVFDVLRTVRLCVNGPAQSRAAEVTQ
jgi:O-antigen/teichoic acid export membrane protein